MCESESGSNPDSRLFGLHSDLDSDLKKHEFGFRFEKKSDGFKSRFC